MDLISLAKRGSASFRRGYPAQWEDILNEAIMMAYKYHHKKPDASEAQIMMAVRGHLTRQVIHHQARRPDSVPLNEEMDVPDRRGNHQDLKDFLDGLYVDDAGRCVLHLIAQGYTLQEIANDLGSTLSRMRGVLDNIRRRNVGRRDWAINYLKPLMQQVHGDRQVREKHDNDA